VPAPEFWLVAGPNGAGKTTTSAKNAVRSLLRIVAPLNPDTIVPRIRAENPDLSIADANLKAAIYIESEVEERIRNRHSLLVETVLSTDKFLPHVLAAKKAGYQVGMLYVTVKSVEISIQRVRQRVASGGHNVPINKQRKRFGRSHDRLFQFLPLLDKCYVFDNSESLRGAQLIGVKQRGKLLLTNNQALPEITQRLKQFNEADTE